MMLAEASATPTSCPACASGDSEPLWNLGDRLFRTTDARFQVRRCRGCDSVFLWPQPSGAELREFYPKGYWQAPPAGAAASLRTQLTEFYRRQVLRDHLHFVMRIVEEQRKRGMRVRILDVGCGDGSFLDALGVDRCVGMDLSVNALPAGRGRGIEVVRGQLLGAPFPRASFSLITMFHFLEHVSPAEPYLESARDLLEDTGDLVVQVPNFRSWQASLLGGRWAGLDVPRHLIDYSDRTLQATLGRSGFEVVRETHFSLRDNATTLANSLAPGLYPPARAARQLADRGLTAWIGDLLYLGLTLTALPFTLVESLCGHGAAVMVQARP